jgi:UbiD family decarboxylase
MAEFPFTSLREWIEFLEEQGDLHKIKAEADVIGEIGAISRKIAKISGPAVLYENIKGYPGWRFFTDSLTTRQRIAWALGVNPEDIETEIAPKTEKHIPPMEVNTGPCKEIKIFGEDVDLTKIPIPITGAFESVPNLCAALHTDKEPTTGWQNVCVRRLGIKGKNYASTYLTRIQQDALIYSAYREREKPMPCAYIIGADPVCELISQVKAPVGFCEYDIWGAITGVPLEVVKCETSDLLVPAHAEIIIEGEVPVDDRELDISYPEAWGYHTGHSIVPRFVVEAITMRKFPIFRGISEGWVPNETHNMAGLMTAISVYRELSKDFPGILAVKSLHQGIALIIQVSKKVSKSWPGFAKTVASNVIFRIVPYCRTIFVIDEDVEDINNLEEVLYGFTNKFSAHKDTTILRRCGGVGRLNPAEVWGDGWGITDVVIFDLTEPPAPYDEGYKRGKALPPKKITEIVEENWEKKYGFK